MAGTLTISTLSDGTNSTSATNCIQGSAKAWAKFVANGSITGLTSYNVSSVTYNGAGDYTINFTNSLTDANYSANITSAVTTGSSVPFVFNRQAQTAQTASAFRMGVCNSGTASADTTLVSVSVFR